MELHVSDCQSWATHLLWSHFLSIVVSDFEPLQAITVTEENLASIRLFSTNDQITLEYEDRVLLTFTPGNPQLIPGLESNGEYIRDTAVVNITDNDGKYCSICTCYIILILSCRFGDKFWRIRLCYHRGANHQYKHSFPVQE